MQSVSRNNQQLVERKIDSLVSFCNSKLITVVVSYNGNIEELDIAVTSVLRLIPSLLGKITVKKTCLGSKVNFN